jgi:hypothetical protein
MFRQARFLPVEQGRDCTGGGNYTFHAVLVRYEDRKVPGSFGTAGQIMISSMNAIVMLMAIRQPTVTAADASR